MTLPLCQKRKAGQSEDVIHEKRVKRWRCRNSWHGVYVRLDSAVLDLGHGEQHIRWCRRKGLWTGAPGDSWDGGLWVLCTGWSAMPLPCGATSRRGVPCSDLLGRAHTSVQRVGPHEWKGSRDCNRLDRRDAIESGHRGQDLGRQGW